MSFRCICFLVKRRRRNLLLPTRFQMQTSIGIVHATAEGGLYQEDINNFAVVEPSPDGSYKVAKHLSNDESYAVNMTLVMDAPWPDAFAPVKSNSPDTDAAALDEGRDNQWRADQGSEAGPSTDRQRNLGDKFETASMVIEQKQAVKAPKRSTGMSL